MAHIILTRRHLAETPAWILAKPLKKELETFGHTVELSDLYSFKPEGKPKFNLKKVIASDPRIKRGRGIQIEYLGDNHIKLLQKIHQKSIIVELHNAIIHNIDEKPIQKFRFAPEPFHFKGRKLKNFDYNISKLHDRPFLELELPSIGYFHLAEGKKSGRLYPHRLKPEELAAEINRQEKEKTPFLGWHYDVGESLKAGYLSENVVKKIAKGINRLITGGKL
ncbi:hypothetical protein HY989_00480 [Candidatus Micrarchaeota archaeon]|nr:hypothetical protein [Candidatus Micrarchaeota archaeon]